MSKINNVEQNEFVFSAALKINEEVIKLASEYNGKVYGDYVKNVIVPRLKDPSVICEYNTISFLFSKSDLHNFSKVLCSIYKDIVVISDNISYDLYIHGMFIAKIKLYERSHSWIFDTSMLYYYYLNDQPVLYNAILDIYENINTPVKDGSPIPVKDGSPIPLITMINKKMTTVNSEVVNNFLLNKFLPNISQESIVEAMNRLFLSKGWTVMFGKHQLQKIITVEELVALLTPNVVTVVNDLVLLQKQIEELIEKRDALLVKHFDTHQKAISDQLGIPIKMSPKFKRVLIDGLLLK